MAEKCTGTYGPNFPDDVGNNGNNACTESRPGTGKYCPPTNAGCYTPFQLTENNDACIIDSYVNEALTIGGSIFNVYKLLGVHEQGKLIDVTGNGQAISGGDAPGSPASNAFDIYVSQWRSIQQGPGVIASAYIGYDFGEIKTPDGSRRMYGIDTSIRKHITAIAIKQSSNPQNRVTRARVERSEDGKLWYGVGMITLPDDDCLNTILFKHSAPMRYWRLRPVQFNGGSSDSWGIQALQMYHNYIATDQYNIQDKIFLENRDRDYAEEPLELKGSYELLDPTSELTKFGLELPGGMVTATIAFSQCIAVLGRPVVIGDIVELPSEAQYSSEMRRIQKWLEVTDVAWSTQGYTPGWQPTLYRVTLAPALVSQETQDLFGDLAPVEVPGELGLVDKEDGNHPYYQDYFDVAQTITAHAKDNVPERGAEGSSTIREWEPEEVQTAADQGYPHLSKLGLNKTGLYVEDAMPPNNAPFTEGTTFPNAPANGDYHRLVYEGMSKDVPARLYRYSSQKQRWVFLEADRRSQYDPIKPTLQEFLQVDRPKSVKKDTNEVTKPEGEDE